MNVLPAAKTRDHRALTKNPVILSAAKNPRIGLCCCLSFALLTMPAQAASTLGRIRQTKILRCATISETPEYSSTDDHGPREAFDTAICQAVAAAILGPHARTALLAYPDDVAAMAALRAHKVDLVPTLTLDLAHASDPALTFSPPALYDGVGFLVPTSANVTRPAQLSGQKICFLAATQVEPAIQSWFQRQRLDFVPFPFNEEGEMDAAFVTGNCAALAGDLTRLASTRLNLGPLASRYALVPSPPSSDPLIVAPDPLAAASTPTDPAFARIVTWTLEVLLNAEAVNLTQAAAATLLAAPKSSPQPADPTLAILTGSTAEIGARIELRNTWALEVLAALGNYGEIYDRTLGEQSPLKLPRAQNRLTNHGGLILPLPLK